MIASEKFYQIDYSGSSVIIKDNFWYEGDLYWNSLMEVTNYNSVKNMLTPMGPIGISVNGVSIYNFSTNVNTITEKYNTNNTITETLNYNTTATNNIYYTITNAYNNEVADNQTGYVDLNNKYHYHTYPITLEGQITLGTITEKNKSLFGANITDTIVLYLGHTYYFNQSYINNKNNQIGFYLNTNNVVSEYTFKDTIKYNGIPGEGYSYVKFTIPDDLVLSENNVLQIYNKENSNTTKIEFKNITNRVIEYKIKLENGLFKISDPNNSNKVFDNRINSDSNTEILYLELGVKYEIENENLNLDNYSIGFLGSDNTIDITYDETSKKFSFLVDKLYLNLYLVNLKSIGDNTNSRYLNIIVARPESINYYFDFVDSNYKIMKQHRLLHLIILDIMVVWNMKMHMIIYNIEKHLII